jgi:hypothetical protein
MTPPRLGNIVETMAVTQLPALTVTNEATHMEAVRSSRRPMVSVGSSRRPMLESPPRQSLLLPQVHHSLHAPLSVSL